MNGFNMLSLFFLFLDLKKAIVIVRPRTHHVHPR